MSLLHPTITMLLYRNQNSCVNNLHYFLFKDFRAGANAQVLKT